jgi:hypothetical protein
MLILKCLVLGFFLSVLFYIFAVQVNETVAGILFYLLWVGSSFGFWHLSRRPGSNFLKSAPPKKQRSSGKRFVVTGVLAFVLAVALAFTINSEVAVELAVVPFWIALYYGWPNISRRLPFLDFDTPPAPAPKRPLWLRIIRGTAAVVAVFVLAIAGMLSIVVVPISLCEHRAQKVANSIHVGMTVQEVLDTAKDCDSFQAGSDFPWDKDAPGDNIAAMGLNWRSDGTYGTFASGQYISLTESEAIQRLHTKLHDGYKWYFSYTYFNLTPMHISFSVVFGPDGRVTEVTPVHGWD